LISEDYQLNLLAYLSRMNTGEDFRVAVHSDYGQRLWNITRNGIFIARGATYEQARKTLLPYIPQGLIAHPAGKANGKTGK
jgi:hypothetical protein